MSRERRKSKPTGWRRWVFPLITALVVPALLLGALELGLRLADYGVPTTFLVPIQKGAPESAGLTTNPHFGWRFFPPAVAREPVVTRLAAEKPAGTVRIVLLGGSAAMGTPDAAFGVGRMLEAMLAESFPDRRFEVVNAAMAAINSHVVRVIGRELADRSPDAFLVYLGNNEVVGPYGPGTVFADFSSSLPLVRTGVWLQGTRTGQLLRNVASRLGGRDDTAYMARWRGMEMFLDRQVTADDPRLESVYTHLAANLDDLVDAAQQAGVPIFLSTVATNLVDEPPFASVQRSDLAPEEAERFARALDDGRTALAQGRVDEAVATLEQAVAIDDRHAAGRWLLGRALLTAGRSDDAAEHLTAARDLDALRFRADSGVDRAIRQVATERQADGAVLVDGAARVAGVAPGEPPLAGHQVFWEHVHLNPAGNHRLALAFYDALAPWLAGDDAVPEPPGARRAAEWLALSQWDFHRMAQDILAMIRRPPFVGQIGHAPRVSAFKASLGSLAAAAWSGRGEAERLDRAALAERPDDLAVRRQLALLLDEAGRPGDAAEHWHELMTRVPRQDEWKTRYAFSLAGSGEGDRAPAILEGIVEQRGDAAARLNLGVLLERRDDLDGAAEQYRTILAADPTHEPARLNLANLLARQDSLDEAETLVREGLEIDQGSARAWAELASLHERRDDLEAAAEAWRKAAELDPDRATVANNLGFTLERLGHPEEAADWYRRALANDPTYALAYFNLADLALAHGQPADAIPLYRTGLALAPGNQQARQNLAAAEQAAGAAQ